MPTICRMGLTVTSISNSVQHITFLNVSQSCTGDDQNPTCLHNLLIARRPKNNVQGNLDYPRYVPASGSRFVHKYLSCKLRQRCRLLRCFCASTSLLFCCCVPKLRWSGEQHARRDSQPCTAWRATNLASVHSPCTAQQMRRCAPITTR